MVPCQVELKTSPRLNHLMKQSQILRVLTLVLTLTSAGLHAQVAQMINYQGRVAVGNPAVNFDGSGAFKFALVNTDGTSTYWSNDGISTAGSEPTAAVTLTVTKGLYSVLLGDTAIPNMTAIPNSVFDNADVRLRIWFNDGTNGSQLLTPDQRLVAVGYIAAGAVGSAQIAIGAVGSNHITNGAVGSNQIANGAVGSNQIASGTITADKLAKQVRSGSISSGSVVLGDNGTSGTFAVTFSPTFATAPIVTLSLQTSTTSPAATSRVFLSASPTTGGFSGAINGSGVISNPFVSIYLGEFSFVNDIPTHKVVNGNPAICYYDASQGVLKYVRATNANGTAWGTPVTIDSTGDVGRYSSLTVVNGNPAISYYDIGNANLKYVRATNADGTAWGAPVSIDSTGDVGQYTSLTVVNGNPAISYNDNTNGNLKYVRATNADGTAWGTAVTIDSIGNVGQYTSLMLVNGNPAISYYDSGNSDLKYVRATNTSGTAWGTPVTVDSAGFVGIYYVSLTVVNGNPAISYHEDGDNDLKYVRATDTSGTAWGTPVTIDSTGDVGRYSSLTVVNGNPAISYFDNTNLALKYVRATDTSGTAWGTPMIIDNAGEVGQYTSLTVVNGNPAISYYDDSNNVLKFARAQNVDGTNWLVSPFTIQWIALEP
jgi:hypothetical protein